MLVSQSPKIRTFGSGRMEFWNAGGTSLRGAIGNAGYTYGSGIEIYAPAGKIVSLQAGGGGLYISTGGRTYLRDTLRGTYGYFQNTISGGTIKGIAISGASITAHFRDAFWKDLTCPICDEPFKPGQTIGLYIKSIEHSELRTVPIHIYNCNSWIRKIFRKI